MYSTPSNSSRPQVGKVGRKAKAKERKRGFGDDGAGNAQRARHHDRAHHIGQDMAQDHRGATGCRWSARPAQTRVLSTPEPHRARSGRIASSWSSPMAETISTKMPPFHAENPLQRFGKQHHHHQQKRQQRQGQKQIGQAHQRSVQPFEIACQHANRTCRASPRSASPSGPPRWRPCPPSIIRASISRPN